MDEGRNLARPPPLGGRPHGDAAERRGTPRLLPALVVLALGLAGTFELWRTIQRAQDAELESNAAAVATLLARVIEAQIDDHELDALRRWAESGPDIDSATWQRSAELFLADHPSFGALVRIDERGRPGDAAGSAEPRNALRGLIPQTAGQAPQAVEATRSPEGLVGPIRLADGRAALGVSILARRGRAEPREVFALLDPSVALRRVLEHGAAGYSIRVLFRNEELFRATANGSEEQADRYWKAADVALSVNPPWTVAVQPTAMLTSGAHQHGALLALAAGLAVSVLAAVLVYEAQIVRARGIRLARASADLLQSIDETEREGIEVRELRGALETRVTQRTATLQETIEELETFNYSVAHDLRSPMGAVINFTGIIEHDYGATLDEHVKDYLSRISASAAGAVALMNGLLAFSQSGREQLRKCDIDMRELVEGVRDDLDGERQSDSDVIEIGALPHAFADPSMMRRVLMNLISNALKFAAPGTPAKVEVGGYEEGREIVFFVRDQGVGFDARYAQKLFGVFERLHSSDEFEGHGVGLAIVSRLIRRHGGRVWAKGAVGKGAQFFFSLPNSGSTDVGANGTPEV